MLYQRGRATLLKRSIGDFCKKYFYTRGNEISVKKKNAVRYAAPELSRGIAYVVALVKPDSLHRFPIVFRLFAIYAVYYRNNRKCRSRQPRPTIRNRRHRCTRTRSQRVGKKLPSLTDHVRRSARSNVPRTDIWIAVQRTDNHNRRRFTDNPHRRVKNAFRYIPDGIHGYPRAHPYWCTQVRAWARRCSPKHNRGLASRFSFFAFTGSNIHSDVSDRERPE